MTLLTMYTTHLSSIAWQWPPSYANSMKQFAANNSHESWPAKNYTCVSIVQCFTSPPTQYRLYGRRFYRLKDPTNSIKVLKEHTVHSLIHQTTTGWVTAWLTPNSNACQIGIIHAWHKYWQFTPAAGSKILHNNIIILL